MEKLGSREFLDEEVRNERIVSIIHIAMGFALGGLTAYMWPELPDHLKRTNLIAAVVVCLYGGTIRVLIHFDFFRGYFKYVTTFVDTALLTTVLWIAGGVRTVKSPGVLIFFVIVAASAFRFSAKHTLFAGVVAYSGLAASFISSVTSGRVTVGSLEASFTGSVVSVSAFVQLSVYFMINVALLVALSAAYRKIIRKAVASELDAERERSRAQEMRSTLCRFVSESVADKIITDGFGKEGERKRATILFCDIRDFSKICEKLDPSGVMSFLNNYLGQMIDIIFEFGGTLDKIVGDCIMAVFGAPYTHDDDSERAVNCAIEMRRSLVEVNRGRIAAGEDTIRVGIGIHFGEVIAGYVGSERRLEYTVVGASVNLAARIEQLTKEVKTDILISGDIRDELVDHIDVREAPPAMVKGFSEPIRTYELIAVK